MSSFRIYHQNHLPSAHDGCSSTDPPISFSFLNGLICFNLASISCRFAFLSRFTVPSSLCVRHVSLRSCRARCLSRCVSSLRRYSCLIHGISLRFERSAPDGAPCPHRTACLLETKVVFGFKRVHTYQDSRSTSSESLPPPSALFIRGGFMESSRCLRIRPDLPIVQRPRLLLK
jgi:hypothetical protein